MADTTLPFDLDALASFPEARREEDFLLQALREGQDAAYETLIERFQGPVYNLVVRLMADPDDACDIVQEVFIKVFRSVGSFKGNSSLKTWIYRIAFNEAYNHRRWFSRHKRQEIGLDSGDENSASYGDLLHDPGRSAFDLVCDGETQQLIEEALMTINPLFRAAVVLRDIEDLSYEEIAEILQVSLGTVKSRILRGREALRKALANQLNPEPSLHWSTQPMRYNS